MSAEAGPWPARVRAEGGAMEPSIHLNWLAIAASVVASFLIGGLWYGPLFGKAWMREHGWPADYKPTGADMGRSMGLNVLGTFLMAFVLAHDVLGWRPSAWNQGPDAHPAVYG